ncbi:hypothetical protein FS749_009442 [Ceratobasidium sp. UAMH 11750]|nr:hypothetical protein FS749_009442 [Ceratobasidium sp. UAMH 11750]
MRAVPTHPKTPGLPVPALAGHGSLAHIVRRGAQTRARDVESARQTREAARAVGVRLPLRTSVTWADAEGADEFPFPIVQLDVPMEDATQGATAGMLGQEDTPPAPSRTPPDTPMEDATHIAPADVPRREDTSPAPPRTPSTASRHGVTIEEVEDECPHTPPRSNAIIEEAEAEGDGNPPVVDADGGGDEGGDTHGECGEPVVEPFSDLRAGAPIDDSRAEPFDLRAYMKSVGHMASPKFFEDVELLLTTKMTNDARDKHLKSRRYRGQTPWPNVSALMAAVDKLPHGPA